MREVGFVRLRNAFNERASQDFRHSVFILHTECLSMPFSVTPATHNALKNEERQQELSVQLPWDISAASRMSSYAWFEDGERAGVVCQQCSCNCQYNYHEASVLCPPSTAVVLPVRRWEIILKRQRVRLAVYHQSVRLGAKPLWDPRPVFFFSAEHLRL
jgi:hypothetical protein